MKREGISQTAAYIAIKFCGLCRHDATATLFPDEIKAHYTSVLNYLPGYLSWYEKALGKAAWRNFFIGMEELLLPGDLMHIIGRKYFLHHAIQQMSEDIEQILILGAGFDHTGSYWANKGIPCFETDNPSMMVHKQNILRSTNMPEDLILCGIDHRRTSLTEELSNHAAFDPGKNTLVLAEGFFDYLHISDVHKLLDELGQLLPRHQLLSTFFSLDELNSFHRFSFTSGVAMVGEAIRLPLSISGFEELLVGKNYHSEQKLSYNEMQRFLRERTSLKLPVLRGFYILQASKNS